MSTEGNVHFFIDHFRKKVDWLANLPSDQESVVIKKLVLVAVIDSLASVANPGCKVQKRFAEFVQDYTSWENHRRVSLPHLDQLLSTACLTGVDLAGFEKLRAYVSEQFSAWPSDAPAPIYIDLDPTLDAIQDLWPSNDKGDFRKLRKIVPKDVSHGALLYYYRNFLVHELREPVFNLETGIDSPYYSYTPRFNAVIGQYENDWPLHYPLSFFEMLARTAMDQYEKRMIEEGCDPLERYRTNTFWLRDLNSA